MTRHTDAPLGSEGHKWIATLSFGLACDFSTDGAVVQLHSGDAMVMNAAAVEHGVDAILSGTAPPGLLLHRPDSPEAGGRGRAGIGSKSAARSESEGGKGSDLCESQSGAGEGAHGEDLANARGSLVMASRNASDADACLPDARLSILFWEAAEPFVSAPVPTGLDGFENLFADDPYA